MGACTTKPMAGSTPQAQGNLVVEGFVRYAKGNAGWTKERSKTGDAVHLEVLRIDKPLGTWRGHIFVENAVLQDCLSYIHYKLGMDEYELLANDEDESIFREVFDFDHAEAHKQRGGGGGSLEQAPAAAHRPHAHHHHHLHEHRAVGDHRSDNTERLVEMASVAQDVRGSSLSPAALSAVHRNTVTERPAGAAALGSSGVFEIAPSNGGRRSKSNSVVSSDGEDEEEDDDDDDDDGEDNRPVHLSSLGVSNWLGLEEQPITAAAARPASLAKSQSKRGKHLSKAGAGASSRTSEDESKPMLREMIFKRQDFKLDSDANSSGTNAVVSIAQSTKFALPKHRAAAVGGRRTHRGVVRIRGALVEEQLQDRKRPGCRVTFVCSMDPDLQEWESGLVTADQLGAFGGKQRVETFLADMLHFFALANNRLMLKFRHLAGANVGEFNWQEVKRTQNELQLGTNVTHRKYGHGIVQSFDMKGRVRVVYDNKEVVDHLPEEKEELKVSVLIGTRVKHKEKGFGTVKAFDESGRVHVKFDTGELHRYKQAAWAKKMKTIKLVGIGGALGTVKLSWRPSPLVREGMGRVKFAVGVTTQDALDYILESNTRSTADEQKGGSLLERRIVEQLSDHERVVYEHRRFPPPLAPRDFVFKEVWKEVAPQTFVVFYENVHRPDLVPEVAPTVRGEMLLSGWLLEPLFLENEAADGTDHVCRVTYQLCFDTNGFVAPDAVDSVRTGLLLGAVTDMRSYYFEQSHAKQNAKLVSKFSPEQQQALNVGALKGAPSMANVLQHPQQQQQPVVRRDEAVVTAVPVPVQD